MKTTSIFLTLLLIVGCTSKQPDNKSQSPSVAGTWKLLNGTLIENGHTTRTDYTTNVSFIKIINDSHFAFLQHDLNQGKDTTAVFVAGGGSYTLKDSLYTEHLEYCNDRQWEGNEFPFVVEIRNDTLIQKGMEIIADKGINRLNIEVYQRVK